jgi:murein DD-endopeptidase MepM/ murein hydrolase activator NlpD
MRHFSRAALCIATTALTASSIAPVAPAHAAPLPHPVVGQLSVAKTVAVGRPPRVTLRVDENGVHTVYVQVILTSLDTHSVTAVLSPGWLPTWRVLHLSWPSRVSVPSGSYQLSVSAHDHRRMALVRGPHTSGETTIAVAGPPHAVTPIVSSPAPVASAPTPTAPAPEAGVPTVAQTVAEGAVFPVSGAHNFGGPENAFGAPRTGYSHQGQDILTAEGTPIVAPLAGTILTSSYQQGGAGYYAVEHTATGFDFMFAHCQAGTVAATTGQAVTAGQVLCGAGQTGDATTPHVDFEMWVNGWQSPGSRPINPLPYLEVWEQDGASG